MSLKTRNGPDFIAYTVRKAGETAHWSRIGAAWTHKDGEGVTIDLEALPLDGKITLRIPKSDDAQGEEVAQ